MEYVTVKQVKEVLDFDFDIGVDDKTFEKMLKVIDRLNH